MKGHSSHEEEKAGAGETDLETEKERILNFYKVDKCRFSATNLSINVFFIN